MHEIFFTHLKHIFDLNIFKNKSQEHVILISFKSYIYYNIKVRHRYKVLKH